MDCSFCLFFSYPLCVVSVGGGVPGDLGDRRSIALSLTARLNIKIHSVAVVAQCISLLHLIVTLTSILGRGQESGVGVAFGNEQVRKYNLRTGRRTAQYNRDGGSDCLLFHLLVLMILLPWIRSSRSGSSFVTFERQRKQNALFCSRQAPYLKKDVVRPTPSTRQRPSCAFTRRNSFNKTDSADADVCNRLCFSTTLLPPCVHGSGSGQGCYRQ